MCLVRMYWNKGKGKNPQDFPEIRSRVSLSFVGRFYSYKVLLRLYSKYPLSTQDFHICWLFVPISIPLP